VNADLREMLAARADDAPARPIDPAAVLAHGERLVGQRRRRTAYVAACGLALVVAAALLVAPGRSDRVSPARPSDPTRTTEPGARPLGYVDGRVLHLGGREVDLGFDALSLDLTDDGAAMTSIDGGIWFSDGNGVERIGATPGARRIADGVSWDDAGASPREWVVTDSKGSLLAWVEDSDDTDGGGQELVVHDSRSGRVVLRARVPLERPRDRAIVAAIAGDDVFVARQTNGMRSEVMVRFAVDGGPPQEVDREAFEAAIRAVPRALGTGDPASADVLGSPDGRGGHTVEFDDEIEVRGHRLEGVVDPDSGASVELTVPGDEPVFEVYFLQWLDDDRFTVWSNGDLLACEVPAGRCRRVLDSDWSFTDRDMPVLPGVGGLGADWALGRAMKATYGQA
jgi:hypothetical protein